MCYIELLTNDNFILLKLIFMPDTEIKNFNAAIPTSIAPWLTVRDGIKAASFYKSAFGATEVYRWKIRVEAW